MLFWTWRDSGHGKWLEQKPISRQERLESGQNLGALGSFSLPNPLGLTTAETAEREKFAVCRNCSAPKS
jgi:hypothetical protein